MLTTVLICAAIALLAGPQIFMFARPRLGRIAIALALLVAFVIAWTPAHAQNAVSFDGFLGGLRPYLVEAVGALVTLGVSWLGFLLHKKFGLEIEAQQREAFQTAAKNAAGWLMARIPTEGKTIDVKNPAIAEAVQLVLNSAPDAIKYFGVTPNTIAQKILDKLPQIDPEMTIEGLPDPEPVAPPVPPVSPASTA